MAVGSLYRVGDFRRLSEFCRLADELIYLWHISSVKNFGNGTNMKCAEYLAICCL
jgi:hypothetical protein